MVQTNTPAGPNRHAMIRSICRMTSLTTTILLSVSSLHRELSLVGFRGSGGLWQQQHWSGSWFSHSGAVSTCWLVTLDESFQAVLEHVSLASYFVSRCLKPVYPRQSAGLRILCRFLDWVTTPSLLPPVCTRIVPNAAPASFGLMRAASAHYYACENGAKVRRIPASQ